MEPMNKAFYWEDIARYDFESALALLQGERYLHVVFMCQQAVEKMVKALYVYIKKGDPPRVHNIMHVFKKTFQGQINSNSELGQQTNRYAPFFARLFAHYISGRYPNYKEKLSESVEEAEAKEVYEKTKEVFGWLESLKR